MNSIYASFTPDRLAAGRPRMALSFVLPVALMLLTGSAFAQIDPNSPATNWVSILYGNNNYPDPSADQQTGSTESDIVGNASAPSLYMQFNSGYLGFRFRVGADASPPGFKGAAFVGLDANRDGALDLFIGVDNSGSQDQIGLWNPGTGLNISPSTTTIANTAFITYTETAQNYAFAPVTAVNDPGVTSFDLNGDGKTDQFLSFFVLFSDISSALAANNIAFDANTPMQLVAATATQANSLNEDLNGVTGAVNSSQTWSQLGASSQTYSATSIEPVPEPSATALGCLACVTFGFWRWNRRSRA